MRGGHETLRPEQIDHKTPDSTGAVATDYFLRLDRLHVIYQRAATGHADDDWLSMVVQVDDHLQQSTTLIGRGIHSGDALDLGDRIWMGPLTILPSSTLSVTIVVTNLGDVDSEEAQAAAAEQITAGVAAAIAPHCPYTTDLGEIVRIVGQIGAVVDTVVREAGGPLAHVGCNGPVLVLREQYPAPQLREMTAATGSHTVTTTFDEEVSPAPCGHAPETTLTFLIVAEASDTRREAPNARCVA